MFSLTGTEQVATTSRIKPMTISDQAYPCLRTPDAPNDSRDKREQIAVVDFGTIISVSVVGSHYNCTIEE
jgi:hypothetical protein